MDKKEKKILFNSDSSWKYLLVALGVVIIAYFIGKVFFEIFPAMEKHF